MKVVAIYPSAAPRGANEFLFARFMYHGEDLSRFNLYRCTVLVYVAGLCCGFSDPHLIDDRSSRTEIYS